MGFKIHSIELDSLTADPVTPIEGQIWYNFTEKRAKIYKNGATEILIDQSEIDTAVQSLSGTPIATPTYIDLDETVANPAHQEGRLFWDMGEHSASVYNDVSGVTHNLGQEGFIRVYNNSGGNILNGEAVYITGTEGTENRPTIAKADASSPTKSGVIGIATHNINNGSFGYVTNWGIVHDLNTSAFTVGLPVYLSAVTPGALTQTPTGGTNYTLKLGYVTRSHLTAGSIHVDLSKPLDLITSFISGGKLAWSSNSQVQITGPTICRDSTDTFDIKRSTNITVDITASGANGLDTGVEASSTWYAVCIIGDSTGVNSPAGILSAFKAQQRDVTTPAAAAITTGQYWTISSANNAINYYVWYNKDAGGGDPAPVGKTPIQVAIVTGDTAAQVATKTINAINAQAPQSFYAFPSVTATFTLVNIGLGPSTAAADVNSGVTFGALIAGKDTPTMPAGYDKFRRIGWVRNNASSDFIKFFTVGDYRSRAYYWDDNVANLTVLSGGAATSFTPVSLASRMPATAISAILLLLYNVANAAHIAYIRPTGSTATTPSVYIKSPAGGIISGQFVGFTNKAQVIDYMTTNASSVLDISIAGYLDEV